jgi:hypothetical protein
MASLLDYYIVHRSKGISYDPTHITPTGTLMLATANKATATKEVIVCVAKLRKGLSDRRYRLVPKTI